ncbi:epoxide hydrolase family protein [Amycolatopsis benzoatilytica]|uniref:epoxide hydrolase family protein n=1 Tax=Amycolatopsis benzoatilytica TaxID=346045 RepID=UPI000362AD6A|nr:epoxide hydrolase family protein [Amycolatopsis benzoatilytica]
MPIKPFRIEISGAALADLHARLTQTRWPPRLPGEGWERGVPVDWLREVASYWATGYDWRAQEARLNEFPQFRTDIDGVDLHFLHLPSAAPDATPLLLTHGWPNSFVEFTGLIEHLADFHVVVPSLPGFGFSSAPGLGWNVARVGRAWAELMRRLGYSKYVVQGGDLGAYVAPETALAGDALGVYVTAGLGIPTEADLPDLDETERAAFAAMMSQDWMNGVDHHQLLRTAPQTFAYGWNNSPVGALAWMAQKFHEFNASGKPWDKMLDAFLTNLSIYWFTGTFGTSSWSFYSKDGFAWPRGQKKAPTGVYSGTPGIRRLAARESEIVHWPTDNPAGHHFIAMDQPEAYAADLKRFTATVRSLADHG